jgi:hypothetical protein
LRKSVSLGTPHWKKYLALVRRMKNYLKGFSVEHIEKIRTPKLTNWQNAAQKIALPPDVFFLTIEDSSIKTTEPRMVNVIQGEDWWAPIMAYLHHHYEPDNNVELLRMPQRAKAYQIIGNTLYKTSVTGPLLRYLSKAEGRELLAEIHASICGGAHCLQSPHSQSLQARILLAIGDWWHIKYHSHFWSLSEILTSLKRLVSAFATHTTLEKHNTDMR